MKKIIIIIFLVFALIAVLRYFFDTPSVGIDVIDPPAVPSSEVVIDSVNWGDWEEDYEVGAFNSNKRVGETDHFYEEKETDWLDEVICPVCNGSCYVGGPTLDNLNGPPRMKCACCGGRGVCDRKAIQSYMEAQAMVNMSMNSSRSIDRIKRELKTEHEILEMLLEEYKSIDPTSVLAISYRHDISEHKERIYQLEQELYNAQY